MYGHDSSGRRVSLLSGPSPITPKAAAIVKTTKVTTNVPLIPSNPVRILPPLNSLLGNQTSEPQKRRSLSPETPISRTPPLIRLHSNSPKSESTTCPMTPDYFQDPMDSQVKPGITSTSSGYHAQMYQAMAAQRNAFSPQAYHIPPFDLGTGDLNNGFSALNQHAMQNLQPPLAYPNRHPPITTLDTSVADLQSTHFAPNDSDSPTSGGTASRRHHHHPEQEEQDHEKPSSHSAGTQTSTISTTSPTTGAATPAKKKFPCPHAVRFDCPNTFTTSGHASRHGKKHTGEKSVVCPTCSKTFTRKDNMKQHERTHKNGSNTANRGHGPADSATMSPTMSCTTQSDLASKKDIRDGPGKPKTNGHGKHEEDGEGESPGLDALAMAAGIE
ncbi:MAG: hypothetical protein LQ341_003689 [Variospora aurantia]|nr:MAG: hypothetical protein LQ341_003689 [Variospora aurantia]